MPRITLSESTRKRLIIGAVAVALFGAGADAVWQTAWTTHPAHTAALTAPPTAAPSTGDPLTGAAPSATASDRSTSAPAAARNALTVWRSTNPSAPPQPDTAGSGSTITEVLRIPALGRGWAEPIYEGVGESQLAAGIGHFPGTEEAGEIGNMALAGHRSGIADPPLRDITAITPGSLIEVTTDQRITYTYTVFSISTVAPTDVDVIAQVPGHPAQTPTRPELTLITCWPADGHAKRVVVEAALTAETGGA